MKFKCVNHGTCRGYTKRPYDLCDRCKQAARRLDGNAEEVNIEPLVWRDLEREQKQKDGRK